MSLLVELGTRATTTTSRSRLLDVQPTALHQRVPNFLARKRVVDAAMRYHLDHDAA